MKRFFHAAIVALVAAVMAACSSGPDNATIENAIRDSLKKEVSPMVIGNMLGGTNGQLKSIEILKKTYDKGEPNAVLAAFGAKPEPFWRVEVHIKGTASIGANQVIATQISRGEAKDFDARATYRLYQSKDGTWYARWQ
jgi:uncharacterized membrane protein